MSTMHTLARLVVASAISLAIGSSASATMVLIDFNNSNGSTSGADTNGNYWTTISSTGTTPNLISSSNQATGISLTLTMTNPTFEGFAGAGANNLDTGATATSPFNQSFAYLDGLYTNSNSSDGINIALSGLLPNTLYSFSTYGRRNSSWANASIDILLGSGSSTTATLATVTSFSATSTAGGLITIRYRDTTAAAGENALLNAMSISFIPEPSSCSILAFGMISLWLFKTKRRAR